MPRYRINSPKVIHQIFDAEVVVVNLESGSYYSIEGAGIDIWRLLESQHSAEEIEQMTLNGGADRAADAERLRAFLREVAEEALIVPHEPAPEMAKTNGSHGHHKVRDLSLDPPRLRKFTDMRDLLLLDPIHELDEAGWPQRGASASAIEA